jgi:hypothetical protein
VGRKYVWLLWFFAFLGDKPMEENNSLTKSAQNHQETAEAPNSPLEKPEFGAPNGPRQPRNEKYDGHEPLEYPGHEAVARHLATPMSEREFKSDSDLADHFHVTRMTIHRTKKDIDVIKRAHWLSRRNRLAGELVARREYPSIIEKAVHMAKEGNIKAMEFCAKRAFPGDQEQADLLSLEEFVALSEEEPLAFPTWCTRKVEDEELIEFEVPEESHPLGEAKDRPD